MSDFKSPLDNTKLFNDIKNFLNNPEFKPKKQSRYFGSEAMSYYQALLEIYKVLTRHDETFKDVWKNEEKIINKGAVEHYLKTINKDTIEQTITIKDEDDNETTFNYGGSGGVTPEELETAITELKTEIETELEDYIVKDDAPGYTDILTQTDAQTIYATITSYDALSTRVTTAEGTLSDHDEELSEHSTDITNLEGAIETANDDIDALESRADSTDSSITSINQTLNRSLLTPLSTPTEKLLTGVDTTNTQAMFKLGNGLSIEGTTSPYTINASGESASLHRQVIYTNESPSSSQDTLTISLTSANVEIYNKGKSLEIKYLEKIGGSAQRYIYCPILYYLDHPHTLIALFTGAGTDYNKIHYRNISRISLMSNNTIKFDNEFLYNDGAVQHYGDCFIILEVSIIY